jgi:phosphomannomutase
MEFKDIYITFLKQHVALKKPMSIVFDASNGPTGTIVENVFTENQQTSISVLNAAIDPDFSAHGPNPLASGATRECARYVQEHRADVGVLFDADGDRAIFLDDQGEIVPAYVIALIIFKSAPAPYVADELIFKSLQYTGAFTEEQLLASKVGAYFVKALMREKEASVAAEYSGHYYFKDFFYADSGIFAAIKVINALSEMDMSLSEYREKYGTMKYVTSEIHLGQMGWDMVRKDLEKTFSNAKNKEYRDGLTIDFDNFWLNIRPSNTEPLIRLTGGGEDEAEIQAVIADLEKAIR